MIMNQCRTSCTFVQVLFDLTSSPYNMVMVRGGVYHGTPAISPNSGTDHHGIGAVIFTKVLPLYCHHIFNPMHPTGPDTELLLFYVLISLNC